LSARGVRLTKGFLLEMKRKLSLLEDAHRLLEMKRDELARELRDKIAQLTKLRKVVEEEAEESFRIITSTHAAQGTDRLEGYPAYLTGEASLEILPRSIIGVMIPTIKKMEYPSFVNQYPPQAISLAEKIKSLMDELTKLTELEASIERIAEELRRTNIQVNALEKVIIPNYKSLIKYIEESLDEEMLEEFVRIKFVKEILMRRRSA